MSRDTMYRQCVLERRNGAATETRVLWGPEPHATAGKLVKVEEHDGSWSEGWTVRSVHGAPMSEKLVVHHSHDYTRQRRASDLRRAKD